MNIRDLLRDVDPLDEKKFSLYLKKTLKSIENLEDASVDDYCEVMEFLNPKIQKWGGYNYYSNNRDQEPVNVLCNPVINYCLRKVEEKIEIGGINIPQFIRVLNSMYPYDIMNCCYFGDDELVMGKHVADMVKLNDGKRYFMYDIIKNTDTQIELELYQGVLYEIIKNLPLFEVFYLFAISPKISYKQDNKTVTIADILSFGDIPPFAFIASRVKYSDQKPEIKRQWIKKLLEDERVNPLIKKALNA